MSMAENGKIGIEKGVPVPHGHRTTKYPWPEMEIGDSFFAPTKSPNPTNAQKRYGYKFTCRTVDGGYRVWRIA
jgi:hypothetical protein